MESAQVLAIESDKDARFVSGSPILVGLSSRMPSLGIDYCPAGTDPHRTRLPNALKTTARISRIAATRLHNRNRELVAASAVATTGRRNRDSS